MNTLILKSAFAIMCISVLLSCGSKKDLYSNYYTNPTPVPNNNYTSSTTQNTKEDDNKPQIITEKKRETKEVDILASQATDKLRAVGIGNDYDEKYARREAIRDAQANIAGYIERAIIEITDDYHNRTTNNQLKVSKSKLEEFVRTTLAQKISTTPIGLPEVYDLSDGTVRVYVCAELNTETSKIVEETYDEMVKEKIIEVDNDKDKFLNSIMNEIDRLSNEL